MLTIIQHPLFAFWLSLSGRSILAIQLVSYLLDIVESMTQHLLYLTTQTRNGFAMEEEIHQEGKECFFNLHKVHFRDNSLLSTWFADATTLRQILKIKLKADIFVKIKQHPF